MNLKKWTLKSLFLGSILMATLPSQAAVWETRHKWNDDFEQKFAQFINQIDLEIFRRQEGPWSGIPTDCADLAYTLRSIFAFENGLPVRYRTWKGAASNEMTDFDSITDPVKRARKFIAHVNQHTSTLTLVNDTYPVAIDRQSLRPGALFLHPQGSPKDPLTFRPGHVYYLQDVAENGIIRYISTTVPARVRSIDARNGIQFTPMSKDGGYRAWMWPDSNERPGYSLEQFEMAGWYPKSHYNYDLWESWQNEILQRISLRGSSVNEQFRAQYENIITLVKNRVHVVLEGWKAYQKKYSPGQCMSGKDYDTYSTPSRDEKLQTELQNFESVAQNYANAVNMSVEEVYRRIRFQVVRGKYANLNQIREAFLTHTALVISEPEHSPEVRWGLEEQGRWPCPERAKAYRGGEHIQQD